VNNPLTAQEQYEKTLSEIEIFKVAIKEHKQSYIPAVVHWKIQRAVEEGLISKLEELQDQAILYENQYGIRCGNQTKIN
jgi:chloramphenicol O-acetyltransferase